MSPLQTTSCLEVRYFFKTTSLKMLNIKHKFHVSVDCVVMLILETVANSR